MKINASIAIVLAVAALAIGYLSGHRSPQANSAPASGSIPNNKGGVTANPATERNQPNPPAPPKLRISARDLFGPPDEPVAPRPTVHTPLLQPPVQAREDPLQHYTYTGSVTYGDQILAMLMDDRSNMESVYSQGDNVEGYTITAIQPEAVTLRLGKQDRRLAVADNFNPVPMLASAAKDVKPNPGNLTSYRDKPYQSFYFQVTGAASGSVWGSGGTYTDDSSLATAAVHAGVLKDGEAGVVHVTVLPGLDHYDGATSNGVTSQSYAEWQGSYRVDRL